MAGRTTKLDETATQQILTYIRAGAFDWVAAQAAGISVSTFAEWMRRGEGRDRVRGPNAAYAKFAAEVRTARAQARVVREIEVAKTNPLAWLRSGPGRTRPGEPGWTDTTGERLDELLGLTPTLAIQQNNLNVTVEETADMTELLDRIRKSLPRNELIASVNETSGYQPGPEDFDDDEEAARSA